MAPSPPPLRFCSEDFYSEKPSLPPLWSGTLTLVLSRPLLPSTHHVIIDLPSGFVKASWLHTGTLFYSLSHPQIPEQYLAHGRCSVNS